MAMTSMIETGRTGETMMVKMTTEMPVGTVRTAAHGRTKTKTTGETGIMIPDIITGTAVRGETEMTETAETVRTVRIVRTGMPGVAMMEEMIEITEMTETAITVEDGIMTPDIITATMATVMKRMTAEISLL